MSLWYEWPLGIARPVRMFIGVDHDVVAMSNPIAHIVSAFSILITLRTFWKVDARARFGLLCGFLLCWAPFAFIKRACFEYHYAIPYMIALCLLALNLEGVPNDRFIGFSATMMIVTTIVVFVWFFPMYYFMETDLDLDFRLFFPPWRTRGQFPPNPPHFLARSVLGLIRRSTVTDAEAPPLR
jgi:dolichyl-phosphate-mannose--protein O-mannosyl transferase